MNIKSAEITDIRVPTSDDLLGSDPFHKKPDYSSALLQLETDEGLTGTSVVFTIGAGTDWICHGIRDLFQIINGMDLDTFIESPVKLYSRLVDHHQVRWLHDGVFRMACGAIINAMWDLWAKREEVPLWKLLVDLEPEFIVKHCIDWRSISDALTPAEATDILVSSAVNKQIREFEMLNIGPKAYCTAGWLGLSNEQIHATIQKLSNKGFDAFKLKVGQNLKSDLERLDFLSEGIGTGSSLMVDANQYWSITEAKEHMGHYGNYNLKWVEEPIARDDVLGYIELQHHFVNETFEMACGEQAASPVIFKQLLKSGAIGYCQIDAVRVAGVNDVMAIILMAAKYKVPVCPHGGGIGLCNMIQHYGMWDQIAVSGHGETQIVEYIDFLQDVLVNPVKIKDGHYLAPEAPGWGLEFKSEFIKSHRFPHGNIWFSRPSALKGVCFEA
ncbi:MAG: enolase C-terminal domain-like protein [Akkermansiaceae bacterium]